MRRHVPSPAKLKARLDAGVAQFCNIVDAKTGKPFFNDMAWNLYRTTVKPIKKGCLSDKPGTSYYIKVGTDSLGLPKFRCTRGTSALEGFHQKLRQLIRGFNISPRLAVAMLHSFIHAWNQELDVQVRGLPTTYSRWYEGPSIEQDMLAMAQWGVHAADAPHRCFVPTYAYADTGETFGLQQLPEGAQLVRPEADMANLPMPASEAWLCSQLGTARAPTRITGKFERE